MPLYALRLRPRNLQAATVTWNKRGGPVPRFMDVHDDLKLPTEAIEQITQDTKDGKYDEFGVRQLELFHNAEGKVYCLLEPLCRRIPSQAESRHRPARILH